MPVRVARGLQRVEALSDSRFTLPDGYTLATADLRYQLSTVSVPDGQWARLLTGVFLNSRVKRTSPR